MPELPADFDLKLMPDWLKEPAGKNPYADYEGGQEDRRSRERGGEDWGRRGRPGGGPRGDGGRGGGQRRGGPPERKDQGKRPDRPQGSQGGNQGGSQGPQGRSDDRRGKPGGQGGHGGQGRPARQEGPYGQEQRQPPIPPANVTIEFFPDESCTQSIARQVKSTHRAYSLFDLARMFLARPERHRLKIMTKSVAEPLYQAGEDGPVSPDRAMVERAAFPIWRRKYYVEVTEQREAPKGNFSNVARCRANGALLGPTNYHGYQPALRRLYEERFSKRMSFTDFQREIEVVNDPALVEQWKEQTSKVTQFRLKPPETAAAPEAPAQKVEEVATMQEVPAEAAAEQAAAETEAAPMAEADPAPATEATPEAPAQEAEAPAQEAPAAYEGPVFATLSEVEQHFRENYLPKLIKTGSSFHLSGTASRALQDRGIAAAVRQGWEQERGFPGQMMHQLRQQFTRAGLHVFKHRKRMQFVSLIRPTPMEEGSLSPSVAEILHVVRSNEHCNRASLAAAILGTDENAVDQARKASLAADLRWLIEAGNVIEFSDGKLELPVVPVKNEPAKPEAQTAEKPTEAPAAETPQEPVAAAAAPLEETGTAEPAVISAESPVAQS